MQTAVGTKSLVRVERKPSIGWLSSGLCGYLSSPGHDTTPGCSLAARSETRAPQQGRSRPPSCCLPTLFNGLNREVLKTIPRSINELQVLVAPQVKACSCPAPLPLGATFPNCGLLQWLFTKLLMNFRVCPLQSLD